MAATIITVTQVGVSGTNVQIKVNDGHPIPDAIVEDSIQDFRTWTLESSNHIFVWTTDKGQKMSMIVPQSYIGWIISSISVGIGRERFTINSPCIVTMEDEVLLP